MSIEMALLARAEIASGCARTFTYPPPDTCGNTVQMLEFVAETHLISWIVIGAFFLLLFFVSTMVFGGHHSGH